MICDKVPYNSYKEAQDAIKGIVKRQGKGFKVYKCPDCIKFHITSIKTNKSTFKIKEKYKPDYSGVKPVKQKEVKPKKRKAQQNAPLSTYKPFAALFSIGK